MSFFQELVFDERLYDAQVLQKAAYRGLETLTVDIVPVAAQFVCRVSSNIGVD